MTETTVDGDSRTTVTETAGVRLSYPQNWPAYNRAQTAEKELFCGLLRDLCAGVPEPMQVKGRPRIPLADALFSACFKVYSTVSGRRFMTDLREAHAAGLVNRPWHFNTVLKVIEDETITPTLHQLIGASAAPLKSVEETFAVDSTGFGTQCFYRSERACSPVQTEPRQLPGGAANQTRRLAGRQKIHPLLQRQDLDGLLARGQPPVQPLETLFRA